MPPRQLRDDTRPRRVVRRPLPRWAVTLVSVMIAAELVVAVCGLVIQLPTVTSAPTRVDTVVPRRNLASILAGDNRGSRHDDRRDQVEAVRQLLAARADAVLRRDLAAFLATVDPAASRLRARQAAQFGNLAAIPFASWSYRLDPTRETPLPPAIVELYGGEVWAPTVELRFALAGFDEVPTVQEQRYVFARFAGRWYLADDGIDRNSSVVMGAGSVRNLWDFGPVHVMRSQSLLVLGHPGAEASLKRILSAGEAAAARVSEVLPDWNRRAVVVVPANAQELAALVEESGDLSDIAAFASADVAPDGPPTGTRVVVNPEVFDDLSPVGRQIVLTHELTHVAARDVTNPATPYWLAEGFADYVAYRGARVSVRSAARELAAEVSRGRVPDRLPEAVDFDYTNPRLPQAYEEAWLACRLLAERIGSRGLVRLYRHLSTPGADQEAIFRREVGMSTTEFVATWQEYLREHLA